MTESAPERGASRPAETSAGRARPTAAPAPMPTENEFGDVQTGVAGAASIVDPNATVGEQGPTDLESATPNAVRPAGTVEELPEPVVRGPNLARAPGSEDANETIPGGRYVVEGQVVDAWGRPLEGG